MIDRLSVTPDHRKLIVEWEGGGVSELAALTLRQQARDAYTRRAILDFGQIDVPADIEITALSQVGPAGVNIAFSDGHDRAIYPFVYLRSLSEQYGN